MEVLRHLRADVVRVKILDLPTTMIDLPDGQDWIVEMVNNILIEVLASIAEQERLTIRQRQAEGIAAAKARGVRFGRPPKPLPAGFHSAYQNWKAGKITGTAAAKECGMPLSTFRYRAEIYEKDKLL